MWQDNIYFLEGHCDNLVLFTIVPDRDPSVSVDALSDAIFEQEMSVLSGN